VLHRKKADKVDHKLLEESRIKVHEHLQRLEGELKGRTWFGGDIFSLADAALIPVLTGNLKVLGTCPTEVREDRRLGDARDGASFVQGRRAEGDVDDQGGVKRATASFDEVATRGYLLIVANIRTVGIKNLRVLNRWIRDGSWCLSLSRPSASELRSTASG